MGHQLCCVRGCKNERYEPWYVCLVHATVLVKTKTVRPSLTAPAVDPKAEPAYGSKEWWAKYQGIAKGK